MYFCDKIILFSNINYTIFFMDYALYFFWATLGMEIEEET